MDIFIQLSVVGVLIAINAGLALSEMALVSSRLSRLKTLHDLGVSGASQAMDLFSNPGRFLSAVQVGISLVSILSGVWGGTTLGEQLSDFLLSQGLSPTLSALLGLGIVVTVITYFSLVTGELVPKQIALKDPESIACRVAPAMTWLARLAAPAIVVLDASSRFLMSFFGGNGGGVRKVTEEEIRALVAEAESEGVLEPEEHRMIAGIMRLADRSVASVMTPRRDVDMVNIQEGLEEVSARLLLTHHSRLVVYDASPDTILGVIEAQEVLISVLKTGKFDPKALIKPAPIVAETMDALDVVSVLKSASVHLGLVYDEYGHFQGIVTASDILTSIVGVFEPEGSSSGEDIVRRYDGSYLVSGSVPVDEFSDILQLKLPKRPHYRTVAGFVLDHIGRIPNIGEIFDVQGWQIEVVDLDGRRVDRILATRGHSLRRGSIRS